MPATRTPSSRPQHLPPRPEPSSPLATTALSLPLAITHSAPPISPQPGLRLPVRPRSARAPVPARPLVHHPAVCLGTVTVPSTPPSTPAPVHGMVRGFCSYRPKATMVSRLAGILPSRARANPGNAAARHSARTISARHERTQRVAHGENSRTNSPRARANPGKPCESMPWASAGAPLSRRTPPPARRASRPRRGRCRSSTRCRCGLGPPAWRGRRALGSHGPQRRGSGACAAGWG